MTIEGLKEKDRLDGNAEHLPPPIDDDDDDDDQGMVVMVVPLLRRSHGQGLKVRNHWRNVRENLV